MKWHVVGIDLSLTNTGVAVYRHDRTRPTLRNIRTAPRRTGPNGETTLLDRRNRAQTIVARIIRGAMLDHEDGDLTVFVIEGPAYMSQTGHMHDRSWLWGLTVHQLFKLGLVVEVPPASVKLYATGKGNADKAAIITRIPHVAPGVLVDDDNAADAIFLALMGCRALGFPQEPSVQRVHPVALGAVVWPAPTEREAP